MDLEQDQKKFPLRFKSERELFISILNFNNFIMTSIPNTYLLVSLIILCKNSGLLQTWVFGIFWILTLIFLLFTRPFSSKLSNIQEILFDLIIVLIVLIFLKFLDSSTEFVEEGIAAFFGWICIGLVLSTIVINFTFQIVSAF